MQISSYPKIHHEGHRELRQLLAGPVVVEEKVDGSQFSFAVIDGHLECRSKGCMIDVDAPDKLFAAGVHAVKELADSLRPGWVYRGEYLGKPKHNTLPYSRIPRYHVMVYDVEMTTSHYLSRLALEEECKRIGLEAIPCYYEGVLEHFSDARQFMGRTSVLGGVEAEGVVIKNHARFGADDKPLFAKIVREGFHELNSGEWRAANPTPTDIREALGRLVSTPARWEKAIQHLRDEGRLAGTVADIGPAIKELQGDIDAECKELIAEKLMAWALPTIRRKAVSGFPDWYKARLAAEPANDNAADAELPLARASS
jgi:ATP-dependent RNA circularization protein (DNA/RNA ligase family)